MFSELVAALQSINTEITDEDIADVIWLARHILKAWANTLSDSEQLSSETVGSDVLTDPANTTTKLADGEKPLPVPSQASSNMYLDTDEESGEGDQHMPVLPLRSPAVIALPEALNIARALRPFKRKVPLLTQFVLNEEATAERSAQEQRWIPVFDYAHTRWLDVALVIDKGASMAIWQQTIAEFYLLLVRHGAFRDVRRWELDTNDKECVRLYAEADASTDTRQLRSDHELIDASRRRLILVVTDCISPAWRSGVAARTLETWTRYNPVTLVQVLPQFLWSRTALKRATPVHLHAIAPGIPNRQFAREETNFWYKRKSQTDVAFPIVTLEPRPLAHWAGVIARAEDRWIPGFKLATSPAQERKEDTSSPLSAAERVQHFRANASTMADRLAGLLTAVPISLPIIRLIQHTMLPEYDQVHLAEVFLGGLLKVISPNSERLDPDYVQYDFIAGVRELLAPSVPIGDTAHVLARMTDFIEENFGKALDFRALLANPLATKGMFISEESRPFAQVAAKVLRPLGGDYISLANWLEKAANEPLPPTQLAGPSTHVKVDPLQKGVGKEETPDGAPLQQEATGVDSMYTSNENSSQETEHEGIDQSMAAPVESHILDETADEELPGEKEEAVQDKKEYDVLLYYRREDRDEVLRIARQLREQGIELWLYQWEMPETRLSGIEAEQIKTVAVFVGKDSMDRWQITELNASISQFVDRPVILVILPDVPPGMPQLPPLLGMRTWVDFREQEPDPMKQLIWGITGKRDSITNRTFSNGYALLIGVGADLLVAAHDSVALYDMLVDPVRGAYLPYQVRLLSGSEATRQSILAAFDWLHHQVSDNLDAIVIVYFSGLTIRITPTDGQMEYFLVLHDYDINLLAETAISISELKHNLEAIGARKLAMFLDSSYSGAMVGSQVSDGTAITVAAIPPQLAQFSTSSSYIVSSSRENEAAYAGTPYSVFTTCLLEALEGKASLEKDGFVRILDVVHYLISQVPQRTANRQHPSSSGTLGENFALCYNEGGKDIITESSPVSRPPALLRLSPQQRSELVDLLLACSSMRDKVSCEAVLRILDEEVPGIVPTVPRSATARLDVLNIVSACLDYSGGLQALVDAIGYFEGDSLPAQRLRTWWKKVRQESV